jgi:hypothetical protein
MIQSRKKHSKDERKTAINTYTIQQKEPERTGGRQGPAAAATQKEDILASLFLSERSLLPHQPSDSHPSFGRGSRNDNTGTEQPWRLSTGNPSSLHQDLH